MYSPRLYVHIKENKKRSGFSPFPGMPMYKFIRPLPFSWMLQPPSAFCHNVVFVHVCHHISHNPDTKELSVSFDNNPAIFVFDLNKIIYGCESFWGIIETETDLKQITDQDIDSIWYVKALRQLGKGED